MKFVRKDVGFLILGVVAVILVINWIYMPVAHHINHIPGFRKIEIPPRCCTFDSIRKNIDAGYEPAFVRITRKAGRKRTAVHTNMECEGDNLEISLLISHALMAERQENYTICKKTAKHLFDVFSRIKGSLEADRKKIKEKRLEFYNIRSKASDDNLNSACFICNSGKLICISINGWIFPLVCQFANLAGGKTPLLNLTWRFSTFKTYPTSEGFVVDIESLMKIPIGYLCQREVSIIEIDRDKFWLNSSKFANTTSLMLPSKGVTLPFDEGSMPLTIQKPVSDKLSLVYMLVYASYAVVTMSVFLAGLSIASAILKNFVNQPANIWPTIVAFFISALVLSVLIISQIAFLSADDSNI